MGNIQKLTDQSKGGKRWERGWPLQGRSSGVTVDMQGPVGPGDGGQCQRALSSGWGAGDPFVAAFRPGTRRAAASAAGVSPGRPPPPKELFKNEEFA